MEHFATATGTTIDVPYVGTENYDGHGFHSYPQRKGWSRDHLLGVPDYGPRSSHEVDSFFQTWLYFGMLIEVFRIVGINLRTEQFIRVNVSGEKYVTTRLLPEVIEKWK